VTYLVVGLSGVGKSTYCRAAEAGVRNVTHVDLDDRINGALKDGYHWPQFFEACKTEIQKLEHDSSAETVILIDVGAGFFQAGPDCFEFLSGRRDVIAVFDEPDAIFKRVKDRPNGYWSNRSATEYRRELTSEWRHLFSDAMHRIDIVGLSREQAKLRFVDRIRHLVAVSSATTRAGGDR
jgi:hypothetical protein